MGKRQLLLGRLEKINKDKGAENSSWVKK